MNSESVDKDYKLPSLNPQEQSFIDGLDNNSPTSSQILQQEGDQEALEREDPRKAEDGGGFRGAMKEIQSALSGGLQDTASSFATLPERTVDMFSGEMQRERQEKGYYRPEWSPFTDYENPIVTNTWWGSLL